MVGRGKLFGIFPLVLDRPKEGPNVKTTAIFLHAFANEAVYIF